MTSDLRLDDERRQRFADAVEASVAVSSREQFFVWTQSSVQGLVPHQILICGVRERSHGALSLHHFSACRYFRQSHFDLVADPVSGLVPHLLAGGSVGDEPLVLCPDPRATSTRSALHDLVRIGELQNLAARLLQGAQGEIAGLYGFARVGQPLDAELGHAVELLIPHLHHTFLRVLRIEREQQAVPAARDERWVTPRQQEILRLIKLGKTNAEIARDLQCSPWTVKNHIQNILHRLGTSSRAHALSRAMSLGIVQPD